VRKLVLLGPFSGLSPSSTPPRTTSRLGVCIAGYLKWGAVGVSVPVFLEGSTQHVLGAEGQCNIKAVQRHAFLL
jgi:hypothetical protein